MVRPREFDQGDALQAIAGVFLEKGYAGASLSDLESATGVARSSLYLAFGDKAQIFSSALEHYAEPIRTQVIDAIAEGPDCPGGFRRAFSTFVDHLVDGPPGCLIAFSAAQSDQVCPSAPVVRRLFEGLEATLADTLRVWPGRGSRTPEAMARYFSTMLLGLSTHARAGRNRQELLEIVDIACTAVFGEP